MNGVPVSEGVYNYYYDIEKNSDEDKSQQEISDAALSDVATYVAVNSEFKNRALLAFVRGQKRDFAKCQ